MPMTNEQIEKHLGCLGAVVALLWFSLAGLFYLTLQELDEVHDRVGMPIKWIHPGKERQ